MKNCIVFCLFLLISCGTQNESVEIPSDFNSNVLKEIMKNPENLSKEKLAGIAGTDIGKLKISQEYFSPDPSKRTLLFSWPNGGQKSVKTKEGKELKMDAYSSLGIGLIQKISKENFIEKFESKEFIQNEINRISKDENIDSDLAIAEAKNLAQNAKIQTCEKLENIGEIAYWEKPVNALHVFANGNSFTVTTNLETEKESKEKAVQFVQLIFDNSSN